MAAAPWRTMDISNNVPQKIQYRGHYGIESAAPSTSTGHVVLHESRHIREFKAEAAMEGKEVINEQIRIQYEFRDGKLVAVSGEATALIADKKKNDVLSKDQILINEEGKNKLSSKDSDNNEELQNSAKITDLPPDSEIIMEKIEDKINKLKDDLNNIQNKTTSISTGFANPDKDFKPGEKINLVL